MDKGKQASRGGGDERPTRPSGGGGLGEELRNMLANQGKGTSAAGGAQMHDAMQDLSLHEAPAAQRASFRQASGRTRTPTAVDDEFAAFQRGQASAQSQLGGHVDAARANPDMMERAWQSTVGGARPPAVTRAPAPPEAQTQVDVQGDAANFLAALDAAEHEAEPAASGPVSAVPGVRLTRVWRPPSPSHGTEVTEEQHAMHERLARLQTGIDTDQPYRQAEAYMPPADDAALGEGVYAPTPEQALATVWDAQKTRAAHVAQFREGEKTKPVSGPSYTRVRGQEVVDHLRGWLVRAGYTDDVYGLPPLVAKTFGEATAEASTEQDEERRAKAIRRLDALYRHLSAPGHRIENAREEMESWLQKHSA
ncbi:hypothetical protein CBS9595_003724 [Malassezia furfur]|nr:hypothetical protein CBS9595_003724 [Malassezia furfur]